VQGQGNAEDQRELAGLYSYSLGMSEAERNAEALKWRTKAEAGGLRRRTEAAEDGDDDARRKLAEDYKYGRNGATLDIKIAVRWYELLADDGDESAEKELLDIVLEHGEEKLSSIGMAAMLCRQAAKKGDPRAKSKLEKMYQRGEGKPEIVRRPGRRGSGPAKQSVLVEWFDALAESGGARAQKILADKYRYGAGIPRDYQKAAKLYEKLARKGDARAHRKLAEMYERALGVEQNYIKARGLYEEAANRGEVFAWAAMGKFCEKGLGGDVNDVAAAKWYKLAADKGNTFACERLCVMYEFGRGVEQNFVKAKKYSKAAGKGSKDAKKCLERLALRKSAAEGDLVSLTKLGDVYSELDLDKEAVAFYRQAAEKGHAEAQRKLGEHYENGWGVKKSFKEAEKWYARACDQEDPEARERLILVRRIKFANEGDIESLRVLGFMYEHGDGVDQDIEKAKYFYKLAARQGDEQAAARTRALDGEEESVVPLGGKLNGTSFEPYSIPYSSLSIDRELARGAFGVVYKGKYNDSDAAIKKLSVNNLSVREIAAIKEEAKVMVRSGHNNVVQCFGVCVDKPGHISIVMELMPRDTLFDLLHNGQPIGWEQITHFARDVAAGVKHLHSIGVLHGDLKSLNILIGNGRAKIADFGMARFQSGEVPSESSAWEGTLAWRDPQLLEDGAEYTAAADVYSLGMVLWELLTRKQPFEDAESYSVLFEWLKVDGKQEELPEGAPAVASDLVESCWRKVPGERPSAGEVSRNAEKVFSNQHVKTFFQGASLNGAAPDSSGYQGNLHSDTPVHRH